MRNYDTMGMFDSLEDMLCKDICGVVDKGQITPNDYQMLDVAVDIYKDIQTIKAMEEYQTTEDGVSGMMSGARGYNGNRSGRGMGRYNMGRSYDSYNSYDGGYNNSGDNNVHARLNKMMAEAKTEQERQIISKLMNEM